MRLFFAIELSEPVREHLACWRDDLKAHLANASFTRDENLHITLKFLGEVDPKHVAALVESTQNLGVAKPISLKADRLECFPNRGPVRIVAASFDGDLDLLNALHRAIEQRCEKLGFAPEKRKYRPHVTLVRARPTLPARLREELDPESREHWPSPEMQAEYFVLMQSHLTDQGSRYQVIHRFHLVKTE